LLLCAIVALGIERNFLRSFSVAKNWSGKPDRHTKCGASAQKNIRQRKNAPLETKFIFRYYKIMKYKALVFAICVSLLGLFTAPDIFAQRKVTIKLAALVPENTPWGEALNRMAAEWKTISDGTVELVIYYNLKSEESAVLRQLNLNQIQAAMLSTIGIKMIAPEIMTVSCPFLIRNNEELDLVLNALKPDM
jgi:hypothetical protein